MFGTIILTAMLTTSSATAEDAGRTSPSGLAAASASQMGQAVMPTLATSLYHLQKAQVKAWCQVWLRRLPAFPKTS